MFHFYTFYNFSDQIVKKTSSLKLSNFGDKVILIMPHPDDMEIHCGGTISTLGRINVSIHLVICSSGVPERLRRNDIIAAQQLENKRHKEQLRAADLLNIERVTFLSHADDFELKVDQYLVNKIAYIYQKERPSSVIFFDHRYPSVSSKKDIWRPLGIHPDHLVSGEAAYKALFVKGVKIPKIFCIASKKNNRHFVIDRKHLKTKINAMKMHISQQLEKNGMIKQTYIFARLAGTIRMSYAAELFAEY